jgi:STE24 endopeptidase
MKHQSIWQWFFFAILVVILLSPLAYWGTGVGQAAGRLSAEIVRAPDGTLASSPKAEARHRLALPMRLERLVVYPLLLAAFQLSGGALALRRWLEGKAPTPPPGQAQNRSLPQRWMGRLIWPAWRQRLAGRDLLVVLGFVVIFDLALALLYLPFNSYSGFIWPQFGLSTQTAPGWAGDGSRPDHHAVMDGLVWTGFYALLRLDRAAGRSRPMVLLSAAFVLAEPLVITPLFYQVRRLEDAGLRARILALAGRADMHVDEVYVIDTSAKTTEVNAYFTGFGGAQRIVLFDTLLTGYTPDQVEVVLAHEMGHWYYRHVWLGLKMGAAG